MADVRASFPPTLASATDARRFAEQALDGWHLDGLRDVVRLLVSELVINAVLHAGTEVTLHLRHETGRLVVEVADGSTTPPVARVPGPTASTGRGLQILTSLSDEWGVDVDDRGKTVWFVVSSDPAPADAGSATVGDPVGRDREASERPVPRGTDVLDVADFASVGLDGAGLDPPGLDGVGREGAGRDGAGTEGPPSGGEPGATSAPSARAHARSDLRPTLGGTVRR